MQICQNFVAEIPAEECDFHKLLIGDNQAPIWTLGHIAI